MNTLTNFNNYDLVRSTEYSNDRYNILKKNEVTPIPPSEGDAFWHLPHTIKLVSVDV